MGRPLRIALLAPASVVHTARWANALAARGHAVHLFTLHPASKPLDSRVTVHPLKPRPPLGYFAAVRALRRRLAILNPDLLNAHYATGYGTLARRCGFRPWALSVWGSDVFDFPQHSRWHRRILVENLRAADRVLSTSQSMADEVRRLAPGLAPPRLTPFGVDTDRFRPPANPPCSEGITIGTVKTLAPTYGIDRLIRAFAQALYRLAGEHPSTAAKLELRIGGDGPQRRSLQRLANRLGVGDRVVFAGAIPHDEVPGFLAGLDLFVALSRAESFGVAVLEASACGLPVVVTDVGGLPEVVVEGETGRIVPDGDDDAAAAAMVALAVSQETRQRMGEAGRVWVKEHYDWARCVATMEAAYSDLSGSSAAT
jgi:glycosyltransferase involved in cell wall biosynthesis